MTENYLLSLKMGESIKLRFLKINHTDFTITELESIDLNERYYLHGDSIVVDQLDKYKFMIENDGKITTGRIEGEKVILNEPKVFIKITVEGKRLVANNFQGFIYRGASFRLFEVDLDTMVRVDRPVPVILHNEVMDVVGSSVSFLNGTKALSSCSIAVLKNACYL